MMEDKNKKKLNKINNFNKRLWHENSVKIGGGLVGFIIAAALMAPVVAWLVGHGVNSQFPDVALDEMGLPIGPSGKFLLGADGNGRDVLVRTLYGARVSLFVGIVSTTVAMAIGTIVGVAGGFFGGKMDRVLSQIIDVFMSFPFVVTALSVLSLNMGGAGQPLLPPVLVVIAVISMFSWTYFARLSRSLVIPMRHGSMVEASWMLGLSRLHIIFVDVIPNILPTILVYWSIQFPSNIIAEATLSFLGVGIQAPSPSWGNMIAEAQRTSLYEDQPWFLIGPGVALLIAVAGFNILSSGLRNVLDPHHGEL